MNPLRPKQRYEGRSDTGFTLPAIIMCLSLLALASLELFEGHLSLLRFERYWTQRLIGKKQRIASLVKTLPLATSKGSPLVHPSLAERASIIDEADSLIQCSNQELLSQPLLRCKELNLSQSLRYIAPGSLSASSLEVQLGNSSAALFVYGSLSARRLVLRTGTLHIVTGQKINIEWIEVYKNAQIFLVARSQEVKILGGSNQGRITVLQANSTNIPAELRAEQREPTTEGFRIVGLPINRSAAEM